MTAYARSAASHRRFLGILAMVAMLAMSVAPVVSFATPWPEPLPALSDEQKVELAVSTGAGIGLVRIDHVGQGRDVDGSTLAYIDVHALRWFVGFTDRSPTRIYANPSERNGLSAIDKWPSDRRGAAIVTAYSRGGRTYLSPSSWSYRAGLTAADAEVVEYLGPAVQRARDGQTLEGLTERASTIVIGFVENSTACECEGQRVSCLVVRLSSVLGGPVHSSKLRVRDQFLVASDANPRLFFLRGGDADTYLTVGFERGRAEFVRGRLPAFGNLTLADVQARIKNALEGAGRN
jgi:hypothetical protein